MNRFRLASPVAEAFPQSCGLTVEREGLHRALTVVRHLAQTTQGSRRFAAGWGLGTELERPLAVPLRVVKNRLAVGDERLGTADIGSDLAFEQRVCRFTGQRQRLLKALIGRTQRS